MCDGATNERKCKNHRFRLTPFELNEYASTQMRPLIDGTGSLVLRFFREQPTATSTTSATKVVLGAEDIQNVKRTEDIQIAA